MKIGKSLATPCLSAVASFGLAFAAQAVEIVVEHDPSDVLINSDSPYSFTFTNLYDPAQWVLGSAEIFIRINDDQLFDDGETVRFTFDGENWGSQSSFLSFFPLVDFELDSDLFADGMLTMLLTATQGDFKFDWAKLVLNVTRRVSEPGTLALLGLGLMVLGFAARKCAK